MSICVRSDSDEASTFEGINEDEIRGLARQITAGARNSLAGSGTYATDDGIEGTGEVKDEDYDDGSASEGHDQNSEQDGQRLGVSRALTRESTRLSQISVEGISPFGADDPRLDPNSESFSAKYWVKNLRAMRDANEDYYKPCALGVLYKDLHCYGDAVDADFQTDFLNWPEKVVKNVKDCFHQSGHTFDILNPMDGLIKPGSLCVVLGRPGAGCSTLLKTIASQTYGYKVDSNSYVSYESLTPEEINKHYRGDVIYNAEVETHFPQLKVGETLKFASLMKVPQNRPEGVSREAYAEHMARVYLAMYGLSHTYNTKVGDQFVRGVSGGERKRVSIAEVSVCGSKLQCWDNSTRGLDSASAENFVECLKLSSQVLDTTSVVSIYQCSQTTYDLFDQVILLYEGRQIFFGPADTAKDYFERQGWECPERQTTADFLTSLTSPSERTPAPGCEGKVPRTPLEFEEAWKASPEYAQLRSDIEAYMEDSSRNAEVYKQHIYESKRAAQANHAPGRESFTVSYFMQIKYLTHRAFWTLKNDPSIPVFTVVSNSIMALVVSSVFYNMQNTTSYLYSRGACLFFACLLNSLMSLMEIFDLYQYRPIVEKHVQYGLYHASADAFASIISNIPTKVAMSMGFNLPLYFMVNLRREPGAFFFYLLIGTISMFVMSHLFRTVGSVMKSLSESMTPSALIVLAMSMFAGFVVPVNYMLGWCRWINYINPISYVFESMMINEFHGREIKCTTYIPSGGAYDMLSSANHICTAVGSIAGEPNVSGERYINLAYEYYHAHKWRNVGISIAFMIFFLGTYMICVEYNRSARQRGEKTVFLYSSMKKMRKERKMKAKDIENAQVSGMTAKEQIDSEEERAKGREEANAKIEIDSGDDIFHWHNVCYDIPYMGSTRRLLDGVDGWVKPGTLTALMGASGAGKTTLLDVLADRVTMGVVTGDMLVNSSPRDQSFQRSTGYVQQQDLHLETSTVREALRFAAYLRQPSSVPRSEKNDYVENIIQVLEMESYADAIVGVPGEGLNVEQRKRLTIGVELVAKPKLLLFLDEPTSGLDSQTAWSILCLIRKLSNNGQAIMCTIHQPSAMLFSQFDSLLLLKSGGQTVYFGPIGENANTLIKYFEGNGSIPCPSNANPAEWMLEAIGAAPGVQPDRDWHQVWVDSPQYGKVQAELDEIEEIGIEKDKKEGQIAAHNELQSSYASTMWVQYCCVTKRVFQQYWRTPSYIYSKLGLTVLSTIFIGFTFFKAQNTIQGLQNQMFSLFMFTSVFSILINQMLPRFVEQRSLYEARERPSRTFSWFAFITAQITVELPWMFLNGTLAFLCFYFPVGYAHNAVGADQHARGFLLWLLVVQFFLWTSTCGQMCIAGIEMEVNAANIAMLLFSFSLIFCGILSAQQPLPGFWMFMYRVSPMTYWVGGFLNAAISGAKVTCSATELLSFEPLTGSTCGEFMEAYMDVAGGYLVDPSSTTKCDYCTMAATNVFLDSISARQFTAWQCMGLVWVYIVFDIAVTIFLYWLRRVPKKNDPFKILSQKMHQLRNKQKSASKEEAAKAKINEAANANINEAVEEANAVVTQK